MMDLTKLVPDVLAHAATAQPAECCGLAVIVKGRLRYWPCRNISDNPNNFEIDPDDYANAEDAGEIVGVCHSHVYANAKPSMQDLAMCEQTGLPWLIVSYPTGGYEQIAPTGYEAPLVGRPYAHGMLDCYQIVVDHYKRVLGIELPHFARRDRWWVNGENLYLDNLAAAGFVILGDGTFQDLHPNDCLLFQMASPVPNHAAIYLGDDTILQHVANRLSSRDMYGGYWRKYTTHALRHRSQL